jgi:hypothetical protein
VKEFKLLYLTDIVDELFERLRELNLPPQSISNAGLDINGWLKPLPSRDGLLFLLESVLATSVMEVESRPCLFKLAFYAKSKATESHWPCIAFDDAKRADPAELRRVSPVLNFDNCVVVEGDECHAWGLLPFIPDGLVIEARSPAALTVGFKGRGVFRYSLSGNSYLGDWIDDIRVLKYFERVLRSESELVQKIPYIILLKHLVALVSNISHGGALFVTPSSIVNGVKFAFKTSPLTSNPLALLLERLMQKQQDTVVELTISPLESLLRQVDKISYAQLETYARLTLVDGATVFHSKLNLIGFGAKVQVDPLELEPLTLCIKEPHQIDSGGKTVPFSEYSRSHGTRHQSAISFCYKNPDSFAFVVSQDGHCSLIQHDISTNVIDVVTPFFAGMSAIRSRLADTLEI